MNKKVLMIGPSPDRLGGVSVHIHRLSKLLCDRFIFDYIDEGRGKRPDFFYLRGMNLLSYVKIIRNADIVHIHSGVFILRLLHFSVAKVLLRKRVIISIHHDLSYEGHIGITRRLLKHCDYAILDSQSIYDTVYCEKAKCVYLMMPAFLPPVVEEEEVLPLDVINWIRNIRKDLDAVLMCSSSSTIEEYNGNDLYGNDMIIEAVRNLNLKDIGKRFYLLMIVHNSDRNPSTFKKYQEMIADGLGRNILLCASPISFVRVMMESDIVLRPTNTDGDSITIREALYLKKATVASDCAMRPEGTVVFKTRDLDDFCDKILLSLHGGLDKNEQTIDYKQFYIDCYENNSRIRE